MRVFFIRHGESEYNVNGLINGDKSVKVHLTAKGRKQAAEAGRKLAGVPFDVIYSSEFIRARETAEIVNFNRGIPIVMNKKINEANVGLEGKPAREHKLNSAHDFFNFKMKGSESWHDVMKRVRSFLEDLKKEDHNFVLVATHEWLIKMVEEIIKGISDEAARKLHVGNCEFFDFEI